MSEAKFTPGPWAIDSTGSVVTANNRGYVAEAYDGLRGEETDPCIAAANAQLIAESPALYTGADDMETVVRRAQNILSRHVDPGGDLRDPMETVNALLELLDHRDTLAKQRAVRSALARVERKQVAA